ncbi:MAG TPA: hypothetical protein GXX29_03525 [Firmicutes bacterium]|nr:hypothetical protein [Bacillota bacterium]
MESTTISNPSWSPDGSKIAFESGNIYVTNADGTGTPELLISNAHYPHWSMPR